MLHALQQKVAGAGVANLEIVNAGFLTYAHTGDPADVVYSRWALHHLPGFWKAVALTRIHSMLRPGGVCACGTSGTGSTQFWAPR